MQGDYMIFSIILVFILLSAVIFMVSSSLTKNTDEKMFAFLVGTFLFALFFIGVINL